MDDVVGTAGYIAPELLVRSSRDYCSTDMWAVGVVFYEILMVRRFCPGIQFRDYKE